MQGLMVLPFCAAYYALVVVDVRLQTLVTDLRTKVGI